MFEPRLRPRARHFAFHRRVVLETFCVPKLKIGAHCFDWLVFQKNFLVHLLNDTIDLVDITLVGLCEFLESSLNSSVEFFGTRFWTLSVAFVNGVRTLTQSDQTERLQAAIDSNSRRIKKLQFLNSQFFGEAFRKT